MFRIDERYSGKEKRKIIDKIKKNEPERQRIRKIQHPISRELDNYFQPSLHERGWFPNGKYIVKRHYYYANPGLGCNYERNNVEQLKDLIELQKEKVTKKPNEQKFIEYSFMEENQYIITIEFCSNCKEHEQFTTHHSDLYKNYALSLQKCILLRFPFISVLLKPIETDIKIANAYKLPKVDAKGFRKKQYINEQFREVRIGAFEVELCFKYNNNPQVVVLHSKLETKQWPKIDTILSKIVSYLPKFMAKIIVYQKETDEDEDELTQITEENKNMEEGGGTGNEQNNPEASQNNNQENQRQIQNNNNENAKQNFKNELIEGLKVNIYLQKNTQITEISNASWENILNEKDPHKRNIMNKEKKILAKQEMFKSSTTPNSVIIENKKFNRSRPASAYSNRKNYSIYKTSRPSSSKNRVSLYTDNDFIKSGNNPMEQNLILDKKQSQNLKGKLIITKFTNSKGSIEIGPLPYDSYYIEVSESRQYRSVGMCLVFNKLYTKNNNYIKRYIGLYTQENSFIQLHVFETKKDEDNKEDPVHIGNARVTIEEVREGGKEDYLEDKEMKFEIKEKSNSPGIFEQTIAPGKYLIKIQKNNYETVTKTCFLQKGLNCINIELFKERTCKLVIKVFNYEKILQDKRSPVSNADVVIYQNANDILEQGITDNKGELEYIVDKEEDFLTIVINKKGYFPIQRTFIRDKNMIINECDQYYEEMSFFLVKKKFIYETKCILITTYCNIKKNNFSEAIDLSPNVNKDKYIIAPQNCQETDGMYSVYIFGRDDSEMGDTQVQTQNNIDTQNMDNMENNENIENNNNNENNDNNENNNNNELQQNQNQIQNNENEEENTDNVNINNNNEEMDENDNMNNINNNNIENQDQKENFENIMNLTLEVNTEELLIHNYQDKGFSMNGLERYGCQTIIYTPKNSFYINSPNFCREGYKFWNIGWIDYKNQIFYQTNVLLENRLERIQYLSLWLDFLQTLINNQIYKNLFEYFGFDGSALNNKDRFIYESKIKKKLIDLNFCDENNNEILQFICEMFKANNNMISFGLLKKKISSNLKNFFDSIPSNNNSNASVGYGNNINTNSNTNIITNQGGDNNEMNEINEINNIKNEE